jgi:hypothetical protein
MKRAFQFGHPTKSVIDRLRLYPEGGELPDENAPVHLDVVDNKDAQARQLGGQYAAFNRWIGRRLQCNVKPETAAGTKTAVDGDFAAHQLDELLADRQTQSGAAKAARNRTISLTELLEQSAADGLRHPNAGVGDLKMQSANLLGRVGVQCHFDRDAA